MFRFLAIAFAAAMLCGCALASQEKFTPPRGTPIPLSDVPETVLENFRRYHPGASTPKVENCRDGQLYRFTLPDDEVLYLDGNGQWCGVI